MSDHAPKTGKADRLAPGILRVLAPNPSPMTYHGTNSYIVGERQVTVIDPGPDNSEHLAALVSAIGGRPVQHIIVTHSHLDHSPLAGPLSTATGTPVSAFGPSGAGRSAVMQQLGDIGGGEGIDPAFRPDILLPDGAEIDVDGAPMRVQHTPGHLGNHICLAWRSAMFTGDHIMGWASTLISPPDGDLTDFMASCERMLPTDAQAFYPGHGGVVDEPELTVRNLIAHRKTREYQILEKLTAVKTAADLATEIYTDTPTALLPAATRNVLAHLIDLTTRGLVSPVGQLRQNAGFKKL